MNTGIACPLLAPVGAFHLRTIRPGAPPSRFRRTAMASCWRKARPPWCSKSRARSRARRTRARHPRRRWARSRFFHRTRTSPTASRSSPPCTRPWPTPALDRKTSTTSTPTAPRHPERQDGASGAPTVFGEPIRDIPISSNKSMIGHTLTAAGAVEARVHPADAATPAAAAHNQSRRSRSDDPARCRAECRARCKNLSRDFQFVRFRRPECLPGRGTGAGVTLWDQGAGFGANHARTHARRSTARSNFPTSSAPPSLRPARCSRHQGDRT